MIFRSGEIAKSNYMSHINPRIERLKEMLNLEAQRGELQSQLDSVVANIISLRDSLFSGAETPSPRAAAPAASAPAAKSAPVAKAGKPAKAPKPPKAPKAPKASGRAPRGSLKDKVFAALEAAGAEGVYVTDLAKALDTKPANIHAWFHAAVKRYPQVKKVAGGHYRIGGKAPAPKAAANGTSHPAAAKAAPAASPTGRAPRGELSSRMLGALESAGAPGITVSELSEKLGVPYKNVSIWFATTGKKNRKIKKVGKAHYKLLS